MADGTANLASGRIEDLGQIVGRARRPSMGPPVRDVPLVSDWRNDQVIRSMTVEAAAIPRWQLRQSEVAALFAQANDLREQAAQLGGDITFSHGSSDGDPSSTVR
jgi:hypothetical protein